MALLTTFTAGTKAKASEVNTNFGLVGSLKLGVADVTVQTTTTTYDVDYADISIAAGDLTANDIVMLEVIGVTGDQIMNIRVDINDVTTPTSALLLDTQFAGASALGHLDLRMQQQPSNTQGIIAYTGITTSAGSTASDVSNMGTGDNDVFTTAFPIRVNFKNASAISSNATIRVIPRIVRG
jgi:hypothetical protein